MSVTWEFAFDDGSGSCHLLIGYANTVGGSPPKHARISGSWKAAVTDAGAMTITDFDVSVTDVMIPLPDVSGTTTWIQLDSPSLALSDRKAPHPHGSGLPLLNTGLIDLGSRFTQLSWGVKITSQTLYSLDFDEIAIAYHETGYLHANHDYGALGGSGAVVAPKVLMPITVLTTNAMRKISAPEP